MTSQNSSLDLQICEPSAIAASVGASAGTVPGVSSSASKFNAPVMRNLPRDVNDLLVYELTGYSLFDCCPLERAMLLDRAQARWNTLCDASLGFGA